jgi:hypothetical protein
MAQITGLNWTVDHLVHFRKATAHRNFAELRGNEYLLETKTVLSSNSTGAFATVPEIPPRSRILSDCATLGNFRGNFILSPIMISIASRGYSYYKKKARRPITRLKIQGSASAKGTGTETS